MAAKASAKPPGLDGLVSRYLNRPISRPIARLLRHTPVTPNQVTMVSLLMAVLAGWLLVAGHSFTAGVAIHVSSVVDGVDGDLARLTGRSSRFGAIFDAVLDRYADAAIVGGMAWFAYQHETRPGALLLGLVALTGAFAVSYSRARSEASAGVVLDAGFIGLASRDVRLLFAAAGCLIGQPYFTVVVIAVITHATVIRRLCFLRRETGNPRAAPGQGN